MFERPFLTEIVIITWESNDIKKYRLQKNYSDWERTKAEVWE